MVWLGFRFDTVAMTVTLLLEKLAEIIDLISSWLQKLTTTLKDLRSLLGKLVYVAQCCPLTCLFTSRMLETLHACPFQGSHSPVQ